MGLPHRRPGHAFGNRRSRVDLEALGERQLNVDCDVLEADGGTRTASITGAFIAALDALHSVRRDLPFKDRFPFKDSVAAVSVGVVGGHPCLDLGYEMDFAAAVDMNVVMTGKGQFVEIQGTGEEATFSEDELSSLLRLGRKGIRELIEIQKKSLGKAWPF